MLRPLIVLVVDDRAVSYPEVGPPNPKFQWRLYIHNEFELDQAKQTVVSRKETEVMTVYLVTPGGFTLVQTGEWPLDPKTGFPNAVNPPCKQWHMTATTKEPRQVPRIAATILIHEYGVMPECRMQQQEDVLEITASSPDGEADVRIGLEPAREKIPVIEATCIPSSGAEEHIVAD